MKLIKLWKKMNIRSWPLDESVQYSWYINDELIENIKVHSTISHHETYKVLREIKTPQYKDIFLFRNKKGFNTYNFKQKYDVIICGRNGVVIDLLTEVKSEETSKHYPKAHYIYFSPVGTIKFHNIKTKDVVTVSRDWLK